MLRFIGAYPNALAFSQEVDELTVCHPGYLGEKTGAKTDLRDATHLA